MLLVISGLSALCLSRFVRLSNYIGALGAVLACIIGLLPAISIFQNSAPLTLILPWPVPYGSFSIALDNLGALFLFPIFILSALAALYGLDYLKHYYGKKNIGSVWFFFNILVASMILVIIARNAVLFLAAWEVMSVSSFFLVMFEGEKEEVRNAGFIYLIAAHIGTLFLLVMFILLGNSCGSFDFSRMRIFSDGITPSVIFLLAVVGFGTKAGFMPMHIWLPEAHPAAPSHVSAVMSGVMIKTGIYGLVKILTFLGTPCEWWGWLLIIIGIISGILGILFALAQHDLKRLLAYSSIENIGIISIGLGFGLLGMSTGNHVLAIFGFTGGLLHVVNHAFFKGLLFLGAGAVLHETGTREIDVLGGLLKKMPITAFCFLIGAAAICGLPPLNGFISEFLIYFASFNSLFGSTVVVIVALSVIAALAVIGGLALACFTKLFGIVFLGEARSGHCRDAREAGILMRLAMGILAGACVIIGFSAPVIPEFFDSIISDITGLPLSLTRTNIYEAVAPLSYIVGIFLFFLIVLLSLTVLRRKLLKGRDVRKSLTWDCGYAQPNYRMQYTASSFAQPLTEFFSALLRPNKHYPELRGYFPQSSSFKTETPDMFQGTVYRSLSEFIHRLAAKFTWFQHGRLQLYILYILLALLALLIWKL